MKYLELALNPRMANQRFSPFQTELPSGMARKLEYYFGDLASVESGERYLYSRDATTLPASVRRMMKRDAWGVVRARTRGDLIELVKFANDNFVPLVPRGGGTGLYGGAAPVEGGIVVDMRDFNTVLAVDKAAMTVRCGGGITFADLDRALAKEGLAVRQIPVAHGGATVAGRIAEGDAGFGSSLYGGFAEDVVQVTIVQPDGAIAVVDGDDLDLVVGAYGTTGFIEEVVLRVRERQEPLVFLASFDNASDATHAARRLAREAKPWALTVHDAAYADLVNDAHPKPVLPKGKWSILVALENGDDAQRVEVVQGILKASNGALAKDADVTKAWNARHEVLSIQRLGPSVALAETAVPADRLGDAHAAITDVARMAHQGVSATAVGPDTFKVTYHALEDERRPTFGAAAGNAAAVMEAVEAHADGRPFGHGVLQVQAAPRILGKARIDRIRQFRRETDPREVFNPGPVLGGRSKHMPFPVKDLGARLKLARSIAKTQRGGSEAAGYRGGAKLDPSEVALSRAIGRVHGGDLASVDYDVTTCTFCAACNDVAPEKINASLESQLPRGRVQLAKGVLEGRVTLTPRIHQSAAENPLAHWPDAVCPVQIPIARVTDLLLGACVSALGPLPAHATLAENVEKEGNVLGKPADQRTKWSGLPWESEARMLFFADDVASYETPDVAVNAATAILNAGLNLNYLGKVERTSGATLVETGQREAAKNAVVPMLEEFAKRSVDVIVSPDANAVRVMKLDWPIFAREEGLKAPHAMHTTTALAQYFKQKRLEVGDEPFAKKVVYHAPEGLTPEERAHGVEILEALGAEVVEAPHHECGHGRALDKVNPSLSQAVATDCVRAAQDAGAEVVVTANPGCFAQLKGIAKKAKAQVEVMDLHTVVAQHMQEREGGGVAAAPVVEEEAAAPAEPEIGPDEYRVEFVKEGVVLAVNKNSNILDAGEEAGLELPSSCRAGSCDTCSARWEGTAPDQSAAEALSADQQKTHVLTCIARPKGPIKIWSDEQP